MNKTVILSCPCINHFQDGRYGKNKRVFNPMKTSAANVKKFRCSSCEHEMTVSINKK